jgi:hypothetical protein
LEHFPEKACPAKAGMDTGFPIGNATSLESGALSGDGHFPVNLNGTAQLM